MINIKYLIITFLFIKPLYGIAQTQVAEVIERPISVCYMNDSKRTDVISIMKVKAELDNLEIIGYFDCNFPISAPCTEALLGKYQPNSLQINGERIDIGEQLNGNSIATFNVGRFFSSEDDLHRFLIVEMADIHCPNLSEKYCYIILCLDQECKIIKHVLYNKENNPIVEEELSNVLIGIIKNVLRTEKSLIN